MRSDLLAVRKRTKWTPAQRATKYLKRIAALPGAKQVCGESYRLTAGRMHFLVDPKFVRLISPRGESAVASALLQLKNDARLFEKWRELQGYTFKANGRMFTGTYWSVRDET